MKNIQYCLMLLILTASVSCKKDPVAQKPEPEYQETRNARITGIELTDKDFRQYFIYREDGLLDSVKREGVGFGDFSKLGNLLYIQHYKDHIKVNTVHDYNGMGNWMDVKFFHKNNKINGSQFSMQLLPAPIMYNFLKINYSSTGLMQNVEISGVDSNFYSFISDIKNEKNKIINFNVKGIQFFLPLSFISIADYNITFLYNKKPNNIPPDIIKLLNNSLVQFVSAGEIIDKWQNLVYGLSGYELPIQEKDEIISQIQYKAFSKEDGSLLQDSTVTFDYQVDTLNRKISFGNQVVSYEFID
ncbi:MAG: hypothetical protein LC105_03715 [Chitinophagales bacterium]|nr:hypothetical protein [Chitinophagales bacterium]